MHPGALVHLPVVSCLFATLLNLQLGKGHLVIGAATLVQPHLLLDALSDVLMGCCGKQAYNRVYLELVTRQALDNPCVLVSVSVCYTGS